MLDNLGNSECNIVISRCASVSSSSFAQADSQSKYLDDRTDRGGDSIMSSSPANRYEG
jgi:hypothetical protein